MKLTHSLLATVALLGLAACAPLEVRPLGDDMPGTEEAARAAASAAWDGPAVVREGRTMVMLDAPNKLPRSIRNREIKLQLDPGVTVQDIATVFANLGYSVIVMDKEAAQAEILVPRFHGTMGGLVDAIERAADIWVAWENGAIVFSTRERIAFTLPQERKLANRIASGIQDLGVCIAASDGSGGVSTAETSGDDGSSSRGSSSSNSSSSSASSGCSGDSGSWGATAWEAGMISMTVTPNEYRRIRAFLDRITENAAIINLQVAMVSVSANQEVARGFDWSKLQFAIGGDHRGLLGTLQTDDSGDGGTSGTGGTGGLGGGTTPLPSGEEEQLPYLGEGLLVNGGDVRGVVSNGTFSMIGFLDYLDTYGRTRTLQSVMLRTVSGSEVQLQSVTEIPYVSGVGIGALGTTNGGISNTAGTLGSANTETANDGITLNMLPSYDAASHSVTIDMSLAIEAVLGFQELSAGNQLGELTQPTTAKRTFNDVIRVRPGQTVVVGGISYDQIQRDNNVPLYLPDEAGHSKLTVKRESMFIVVRPTVTILGAIEDAERDSSGDKATGNTVQVAATAE